MIDNNSDDNEDSDNNLEDQSNDVEETDGMVRDAAAADRNAGLGISNFNGADQLGTSIYSQHRPLSEEQRQDCVLSAAQLCQDMFEGDVDDFQQRFFDNPSAKEFWTFLNPLATLPSAAEVKIMIKREDIKHRSVRERKRKRAATQDAIAAAA